MDKVMQVLKYQFWILLVIALILPLVGWSMATSGLVSEAAARTEALKKLNESLKVLPDDPNNTWEQALQTINLEQGKQSQIAQQQLYIHQLPLMVWPDRMPSDPALIQTVHQEFARTNYRDWVEQVRQVVKPYDEGSESGMIEYSEDLLPRPDLEEWVSQAPSVKQIEAAQEDLWLLTSMLKAIASVNSEAATRFDAPIRRIEELYLRGGSKGGGGAKPPSMGMPMPTAASGGPAGHAGGSGGISAAGMMAAGFRGGGGASRDAGGATAIAAVKINPDEDLGPESTVAPASAAGGDSKTSGSPAGQRGGMPGAAMAMTMGGGTGGTGGRWGGSTVGRYREEKPEWKTRGFYLEVIMDHRRVPDLLVALANADWPVNVLRVQMADYQDEDLADADGGGMLGGGGMMPGSGRGGAAGHGASPARPVAPTRGVASGPAGHAGGTVGRPTMPPMPRAGRPTDDGGEAASMSSNRSALDDPNLANVAIVGTIYIFNKPKPAAAAPGGAPPATTPANATPPVAAVPAGTPAVDPKVESGKSADDADSEPKSAQPVEDKQPEPEKPADPAPDSPESKPPVDK